MVIFGGRLVDAKKRAPNKVPLFLEKAFTYLEQQGLDSEGLFRVSGSLENIKRFKESIEKGGGDMDWDKTPIRDVHEVAGLVKAYFRELSEPLVPTSMMKEFVSVGANENNNLNEQYVSNLLSRLPADNYAVMKRLMLFLKKVSEYASVTKMTSDNLALVFSPNLIRDNSTGWEREMMWSGHISAIVAFLISRASTLFNEPGPITKPLPPTTSNNSNSQNPPTPQRKSGSGPPVKRPPSGGRKNTSSIDISTYTLRGEYRVGMALNLPLPPLCLQGCNWGPLVQTGKISVYTSGETTLVAVIITSDEGKTLAQAIAANIMDTSDSSRYFVVPRALSPILSPKEEAGVSYFGVALYTPEDSIAFRALIDPHRPEDYITHRPNASGAFVLNATNSPAAVSHPRTVSIATPVRTAAFRKPVPPPSSATSSNHGYTPGAPYRKMINLSLDDEELIVYERIVQLSYANVYRCAMGPLCCMVKIFSKPDDKVIQYTLQDHTIRLKHANLLRPLGSQFEENIFCSFYEYCGNNSVWELMYRHKVEENPLPYRDIKHYATMVARALVHLHENNTPHRDIKSCNVFLDGDEEPFQVVKLGDVCSSLSLNIKWPIMYTSTFPYTPPEVLEDASKAHTADDAFKIDIWQFGMLLVELETLGMPFEGLSEEDTQNSIMTGRIPPNLPPTSPILPLVRKCLQVNPSDRLSAQQVLDYLSSLAV